MMRQFAETMAVAIALGAMATSGMSADTLQNSTVGDPEAANRNTAPVTVVEDQSSFTLANGYVTAKVDKTSGDLTSLKYKGLELIGYGSGHPAGYWEQDPSAAQRYAVTVTIDPARNGGERGEVSIKGFSDSKTYLGDGPGGSTLCDIELRYTLGRHDSGLYTYAIYDHPANYPGTQIGESRFGAKLNGDVFDWLSIDANRDRLMITGSDWDHGTELNMKEVRRINTGQFKGEVSHKYDYSAIQFNIPAFGWSSTKQHVGLWFINPSVEYLSGGATKVELTGHLDNNPGGAPTVLNYWRGTHYGGSVCAIGAGEKWTKVVGPMMIYLNSAPTPNEMFKDALAQAAKEATAWPYDWVSGVDYPRKNERSTVSGQLVLRDPQATNLKMSNLLVGLSAPEYTRPGGWGGGFGGFGGPRVVDWQNDAKHYEFWVRGDNQGHFTIPKVRAGTYTLHAIADGILGEYARTNIAVESGMSIDLGRLEWTPVRYGRQLWDIGIPNRTGSEFFKGDDYFHWGMYLEYARLFPNDVNYIIGKSDFHKDWYFEQVPHCEDPNNTIEKGNGRGSGRSTTWTITFNQPAATHGKATLRLAICGVSARSIEVTVNDKPAGSATGLGYNATINRDGIGGYWVEKDVVFDASLMKAGENVMKLTIPAGGLTSGIIYDYLRLEVDASAKPPATSAATTAGGTAVAVADEE
ncbi:MAG: polysaccharide lyase family protein [Verrucomicrobiia bacterium]|jgi:rhamnogalacturonan endolyase